MTTTTLELTAPPVSQETYLNSEYGIRSWLLTKDHKRIAVMFLIVITLFFFVGGAFATLIRLDLVTPQGDLVSDDMYNRLFTMHGIIMVFFFLVPSIPATLGNFLVPMMIGARDLAFPRINLLSFYLLVIGGLIALVAIVSGGVDTGWTFYTPFSSEFSNTHVVMTIVGIFIAGFSSILTGLNFVVTIHTMRCPGMTWMRMPLFLWSIYATSIIQVLATPVIGLTTLLVAAEHTFGFGFFDPARGGDPILFQHLFWFYSHPAVYIMVLPAMGVISETICAYSRKNIFGYKMIAMSSLGIAFVGFFAWGHHLFTSGQSAFDAGAFAAISMLVGVFTAIKVFNWVGTLYKGSIAFTAPFAYICGFLFFLVFGGMTGVALATVSLDVHWQDTYFVVAHFHFIMVGAVIMGFLAALHYWFPKMFGRKYPENWALLAAGLIVLGFNATFIPQFLLGNAGMPRRYYEYPERFAALNVASTAGASLLAFGFIIIAIYLAVSLKYGEVAGRNPWGSRGYEWDVPSPPPTENFDQVPVFTRGPHEYQDVPEELAKVGHAI
ncbi:MAG: cytochrome c oxidase subunit I [Myxococcaceae bacterium]